MTTITPAGVERLRAAKRNYAAARRALDDLRRNRALGTPADQRPWLEDANRRVKEAFVEWVMLFEHETGLKLASLFRPARVK